MTGPRPSRLFRALRSALIALTTIGFIGSCGGDSAGPAAPTGPGTVFATLAGPNLIEGAVRVRFTGQGTETIRVPSGDLFIRRAGSTVDAILVGSGVDPLRFEFDVPDVGDPPAWTILQVAGSDDALRDVDSRYRFVYTVGSQ